MNAMDKFIIGDTESIEWCFENTHFKQRLLENGIKREDVVDMVMYEEPVQYDKIDENQYSVLFKAPTNKDYKELKLIFACNDNRIDLVTIMPNSQTATNRQQNKYKSDKRKSIEKKRNIAMSKRKW